MAAVERTAPAGASRDVGDLRPAHVHDVHVNRGSRHAVVLGQDEAAEAVQDTWGGQLLVERLEERAPGLV